MLFLGNGPEHGYLSTTIIRTDLVEFYGRFSRNDLGSILAKDSDILILPPKTQEDMILTGGLSTKIFDYLSMEMPILAPSDQEINTVLTDRYSAVLYRSNNANSFVECVQLLVNDLELKKKVSKSAYQIFKKKYSWYARMRDLIRYG